jgi:hypothetical protein
MCLPTTTRFHSRRRPTGPNSESDVPMRSSLSATGTNVGVSTAMPARTRSKNTLKESPRSIVFIDSSSLATESKLLAGTTRNRTMSSK